MKGFLTKQVGPFPMYAWLGGGAVLVVAFLYLRGKGTSTSTATPGPQVAATVPGVQYPYPDPGSGAAGIPPTAPFDNSQPFYAIPSSTNAVGQAVAQGNPTATWSAGTTLASSGNANLGNYNPGYAASVQPYGSISTKAATPGILAKLRSTQMTVARIFAPHSSYQNFNPVLRRSSGSQAI